MTPSALIVIPTTGSPTLEDAIVSALTQTYKKVDTWVIIDGPEFADAAIKITSKFKSNENLKVLTLPANTGANGWYGHRIYAAVSYLFNHDFVLYLDQDNWFDADHVTSMVAACVNNNWHWCHSLRKVYRADKTFVCNDNCESLGKWPIYFSNDQYLVDTSTYCIRKEIIVQLAPAWYSGWGGDRRFYSIISKHVPQYGCTGKYSVSYRLDGNPNSVNADFFINGNAIMESKYPVGFPWSKEN